LLPAAVRDRIGRVGRRCRVGSSREDLPARRLIGDVPALLLHYDRIISGKAQYERFYLFRTPACRGYGLETMDFSPI
jgi:hypothetical protein